MSQTHALRANGAPFTVDGDFVNDDPKSTSGEGRAACSCGWVSETLSSGGARRSAHKIHKADPDAAPAEPEETPVAEAPAEPEAEAVEETQETQETPEEEPEPSAEEDAPVSQQETQAEPEEDDGVTVAYRGHGAAKSFWRALGVDASAAVAKAFDVVLKYRTKDHTVSVYGDRAEEVAEVLPRLWSESQPYFREWKKTDAAYLEHDKRTKVGLAAAYDAELAFFRALGDGVAAAIGGSPKKNGSAGYKAGVNLVASGGLDEVDDNDLI